MDVDAALAGLLDGGAPTGERAGLAASLTDCAADDVRRVEAALSGLAGDQTGVLAGRHPGVEVEVEAAGAVDSTHRFSAILDM